MASQKYITGYNNLANYLGMKLSTVEKNVQNGIIPKRKLGVNAIFIIEEVDNVISDIQN
ncbi:hypothetical protein [Flavicella sp.]|uniref:hypothetical protein n=1 Tax=Flavicella sp. TaxID=2957742 RepID=UPI003018B60D